MSLTVVWISRASARLFHFSHEKMERNQLALSEKEPQELQALFLDTVNAIPSAGRILLAGPDMAKHHFQAFLTEHHPLLGKRIVAIEAMEHATDSAIAALAEQYFFGASA